MAAKRSATQAIDPNVVRAYTASRQCMAGALAGRSAADVTASTGWLRSIGGCNPYLALRDRAGLSREAVDRAVADLAICELPSARGCTYVVPSSDFAIALRAGQGFRDGELAIAKKHCGVTDKEIARLEQRVLDAVVKEPLEPSQIREVVGDAARSLGPEGKKRGLTTTLPIALGRLQSQGEIRRVPIAGRLDQQRYRYARWSPSPVGRKPIGEGELAIELARRFFRWAGPATPAHFAWWSGLGMKAARAAAMEIGVVPLAEGDERLMYAEDRDALLATKAPKEPAFAFVSALDNLVHLRRELATSLDEKDALKKIPGDAKGRTLGGLADLEYHPIVDRGRIVGLWDWDGVAGELAYKTFGAAPSSRGGAAVEKNHPLERAAADLARYVKSDLGDVRSFSLDSPESRTERIALLKKAKW